MLIMVGQFDPQGVGELTLLNFLELNNHKSQFSSCERTCSGFYFDML